MPSDATTFLASFALLFGGIAAYLMRLARMAARLRQRADALHLALRRERHASSQHGEPPVPPGGAP